MSVTKYTMRKLLQNTPDGRLLRTAAHYKTTLETNASLFRESSNEAVRRNARATILRHSQELFELNKHHPVLNTLADQYHRWIIANKVANS